MEPLVPGNPAAVLPSKLNQQERMDYALWHIDITEPFLFPNQSSCIQTACGGEQLNPASCCGIVWLSINSTIPGGGIPMTRDIFLHCLCPQHTHRGLIIHVWLPLSIKFLLGITESVITDGDSVKLFLNSWLCFPPVRKS